MAQLYFYYSAMNAGKSTALLQSSYNYQERGMRTLTLTAEIDNRHGVGRVSSRIGLSSPALLFNRQTDLFQLLINAHREQSVHSVLRADKLIELKTICHCGWMPRVGRCGKANRWLLAATNAMFRYAVNMIKARLG